MPPNTPRDILYRLYNFLLSDALELVRSVAIGSRENLLGKNKVAAIVLIFFTTVVFFQIITSSLQSGNGSLAVAKVVPTRSLYMPTRSTSIPFPTHTPTSTKTPTPTVTPTMPTDLPRVTPSLTPTSTTTPTSTPTSTPKCFTDHDLFYIQSPIDNSQAKFDTVIGIIIQVEKLPPDYIYYDIRYNQTARSLAADQWQSIFTTSATLPQVKDLKDGRIYAAWSSMPPGTYWLSPFFIEPHGNSIPVPPNNCAVMITITP